MFEEMAVLVDAQGEMLDAIEASSSLKGVNSLRFGIPCTAKVHVNNTKGYTAQAEQATSRQSLHDT